MKNQRELKHILRAVEAVYWDDYWSLGPMTTKFEEQAHHILFNQQKRALLVNNGTTAIELALQYIIQKGGRPRFLDRAVLMPVMTVPMVRWAIERAGFEPVLVDCGYDHNMDREDFIHKIRYAKPAAAVWVYTAGFVPDGMDEIRRTCDENDCFLIEDFSHAHLSESKDGVLAGTVGHFACASMYATKVLNAGEGGIVAFDQTIDEDFLRILRNQGKPEGSAEFKFDSYNFRANEFTAAVALVRLLNLPKEIADRKKIAGFYNARLSEFFGMTVKHKKLGCRPSFYKYVLEVPDGKGKKYAESLVKRGARVTGFVHDELLCKNPNGNFRLAQQVANSHICLPLDSKDSAQAFMNAFKVVGRSNIN